MGADLCLIYVNFVGEWKNDTWKKRQNNMLKALAKYKFNEKDLEYDWVDFYETINQECPENKYKIRVDAKHLIREFFDIVESSREVNVIDMPFRQIAITGGMSWGDDPTEAFPVFNRFLLLPECILKAGDVEFRFLDPYEMFIKVYKDIPDSLRNELIKWKCAEKV